MTTRLLCTPLLTLLLAATSHAQPAPAGKTVILQVQAGVLNTREGHQTFAALDSKYATRKAELDKKQADIAAMQEQLRKGAATMSADAQRKLARDIDRKTKALEYEADTTQAEYQQEQADLTESLVGKFREVVDKYAKDNGFGLVLDVSNPQTPAFWWGTALDITNEVVRAYDAAHPVK